MDEHDEFIKYSKKIVSLVDEYIYNAIPEDYGSGLKEGIKYATSSGKKIRPILAVLSYQALGGKMKDAVPLAAAVELIHNATLVHDDIIDRDILRRNKETVCNKFGMKKAIVIGDAMISLAINISTKYGVDLIHEISKQGFDLCNGEFLDISLSLEAPEELLLLKIRQKSASLFTSAAISGAMAAGGSKKEISSFSRFGEEMGIAYQLKDDLTEIIKCNGVPMDFKNACINLPLLHLYKNSDEDMKRFIKNNLGEGISTDASKKIIGAMKSVGSIEYCEKMIDRKISNAKDSIIDISNSVYKNYLLSMPDLIIAYLEREQGFR